MIIFLTMIAFFIASCGTDARTDTKKVPDAAIVINNIALEKATPAVGGIKLVRYSPISTEAGIADMELRGYKVKQITDVPGTLFQSPSTTVMYERVK